MTATSSADAKTNGPVVTPTVPVPVPSVPATLTLQEREEAIDRFQAFLRFDTVSATSPTTGSYRECATFLLEQLRTCCPALDDVFFLPEAPDHSPVVVALWEGVDPSLPVLLLNGHYDVVPADETAWTVPPFDAVRKDGKIYGRGAQDMKCVCMQYIEAVKKLQTSSIATWRPARTVVLTFVPDEEVGGSGMAALLESDLYRRRLSGGVALALDEGLASTTNVFDVFYGERLPWWVEVKATGPTGHASRFIENTAVGQLLELSQKALAFRRGEKARLEMSQHENCTHAVVAAAANNGRRKGGLTLGDVTSLNITTLKAGVAVGDTFAYNVVPPVATCSLDIRISPHMDPQQMKDLLDGWCRECSAAPAGKVTWSSMGQSNNATAHATTETDRTTNPWYGAFCDALSAIGCEISPQVFPAATDSRFLRALGVRALGFSPMRNTEILLHENDEYILEANFLEGIEIYVCLIRALGSHGEEMDRLADRKRKGGDGGGDDGSDGEKKDG